VRRLILAELRKVILVASQFFEFLHSLGHSQPSLPGSCASDVRYAPNSDQRIAAPRLGAMGPLAAIGASHRLREAASVGGLFIFKGSVV
jgi:hypothetical protein